MTDPATADDTKPPELNLLGCRATATWPAGQLDLQLDLKVDESGRLLLSGTAPLTEAAYALSVFLRSNTLYMAECSIVGSATSGQTFRTEHAALKSWKDHHAKGITSTVAFVFDCAELWLTSSLVAAPARHYEYWVEGLRCHATIAAAFDFGEVRIAGANDQRNPQSAGQVNVVPKEGLSTDEVDAGVDRVLDVLSLANGRLLRWSTRQRIADEAIETRLLTRYEPPPARWPVFSHLDMTPIVLAAARTYTREACESTGLSVAIRWMLAHSDYESVRFVQHMTALEHLLEKSRGRITLFPKALFKTLRDRFGDVLVSAEQETSQSGTTFTDEFASIRESIAFLNQRSLKKQIESVLGLHSVPLDGVDGHIADLVRLRNDLVHRGVRRETSPSDTIELEAVLRELLVRIVLSMLRFEGMYISWRDGRRLLLFPSLAAAL